MLLLSRAYIFEGRLSGGAGGSLGGDLFSSFIKRRLAMPTSSRAIGLDQIPKSLFPLLAVSRLFSVTYADILLATAVFFLGELLLSRILFRLKVRDRPY